MVLLVALLASGGVVFALNTLNLSTWRGATGLPWTERAAFLYPARESAKSHLLTIPASFASIWVICSPSSAWLPVFLAGIAGALFGSYPLDRAIFPSLTFPSWLRLTAANTFLESVSIALFLAAAGLMPIKFSLKASLIAAAYLTLQVALEFGIGIRLMRVLGLFKPAPRYVVELVSRLAGRHEIMVRSVWMIPGPANNALALVVAKEVAFTEGLLAELPEDELSAVAAHELGHLKEGWAVHAARVIGRLWFLPLIFFKPVFDQFDGQGLFGLGVVLWVCNRLNRTLQRTMEKKADKFALGSLEDSKAYARALERMSKSNQMPLTLPQRGYRTHPDTYDRILAAGVTPECSRPLPPPTQCWTTSVTLWIAAISGAYAIIVSHTS